MRKFLRGALVSAASLVAFVQPAHAEWLQAKSKHFIVYGDMPENELKRKVERLERFHGALRTLFKADRDDVGTIYIVGSLSELQELAGSSRVGGYYRGDAQGPTGFVPEKLPYQAKGFTPESILFHEYTHHILLSTTNVFYPRWMSEGLAELFMTANLRDDGSVIFGQENPSRVYAQAGMNRWSVERLLDSDSNPPKGDEAIELYSRGWLMLHYLLFSGKRPGQFLQFFEAVNKGEPALEVGRRIFGDLGKLNNELDGYVRSATLRSYLVDSSKLAGTDQVEIVHLSQGERDMLPLRIVSANGVNKEQAVKLVARARPIADRYPNDAMVQRYLAEMEFDAGELDRADAAADRSLAADPQNVMAMVYKGRAAAKRAVEKKDAAQWKTARSWFLRANRAKPDYALPLVLYYDSFVGAGEPAPKAAVDSLGGAMVLAPADSSLRARLGVELIRQNNMPLALTILSPIAFDPHASGKNPYAKLVNAMKGGASQEALLAQAKELKIDAINEFTEPAPQGEDEAKKPGEGDKAKDKDKGSGEDGE